MKSRKLSKLLVSLLAAAMAVTPVFAVTNVAAVSSDQTMSVSVPQSSSWEVNSGEVSVTLPRDTRVSFDEAAERYTGGKIEALACYTMGIVSGVNYDFICRETSADGTVTLKKARLYDPNYVNSYDRTAKARFTSVEDLDLDDYQQNHAYILPEEETIGGASICCSGEINLSKEFEAAFEYIQENSEGLIYEPLAYLGKRVSDSGKDYAFLCCSYFSEKRSPDKFIDIITIHADKDGSVSLSSKYSIFGQRTYFPNQFENKCSFRKITITLGETVKVDLAAKGGTGNYKYKLAYRKMNTGKWIEKEVDGSKGYASFKPSCAVTYEAEITVSDGKKERTLFTYIWVNEELKNTSTISAETIKKGETVTLTGSSTGGDTNKQYAVYYKKKTSEKWTAVQKYNSKSVVKVKPLAAADYDICIKVKDRVGKISKKYFTVSVTK